MVESNEDKTRVEIGWKTNGIYFWNKMKNNLKLLDPLEGLTKETKTIWFTWCNSHKVSKRIYYRLDIFYANNDLFNFDQINKGNSVKIHPCSLSNRHPIEINILNHNNRKFDDIRRKIGFKLNIGILNLEDCNNGIFILKEINKILLMKLSSIDE